MFENLIFQIDYLHLLLSLSFFFAAFISFVLNDERFDPFHSRWGWLFYFCFLVFLCRFFAVFVKYYIDYYPYPITKTFMMFLSSISLLNFIIDLKKDHFRKYFPYYFFVFLLLILFFVVFGSKFVYLFLVLFIYIPIGFKFFITFYFGENDPFIKGHLKYFKVISTTLFITMIFLSIPIFYSLLSLLVIIFAVFSSAFFTYNLWKLSDEFLVGKVEWTILERFNRNSLFSLFLLIVFGLILVNFVGKMGFDVSYYNSKLYFDQLKTSIDYKMEKSDQLVKGLSGSPVIIRFLNETTNSNLERANSVLKRYKNAFECDVCYLLDKNGKVIASSNVGEKDSLLGNNYSSFEYFIEAINGREGKQFLKDVITGLKGYYSSYPVYDEQGRIMGVVVARTDIKKDDLPLKKACIILDENSEIFFLNQEGEIFLKSFQGKNIKEIVGKRTVLFNTKKYILISDYLTKKNQIILAELADLEIFYRMFSIFVVFLQVIIFSIAFHLMRKQIALNVKLTAYQQQLLQKNEQLESFFNVSLDLLCIVDQNGKFIKLSKSWEKLLGIPLKELENRYYMDFVYQDDIQKTLVESMKTLLGQSSENFINRYVSSDGKIKYLEWKSQESGGFIYAAARDVTEKIRAEKELMDSKNFLDKIINSFDDPIFVKDKDHKWILINEAFTKMTGLTREMAINKSDYDYFPKEQADVFWEKDNEVFVKKETVINEETITTLDGQTRIILTKKYYFENSSKEPFLVGIITDITEIKEAQEKIKKSERLLSEMGRIARIGAWELDMFTKTMTWTDMMYEIFEISDRQRLPKLEEMTNFCTSDYKETFKKSIDHLINEGKDFDLEVLLSNNVWARIIGKPLIINGTIKKIYGTLQDITQLKKAKDSLIESEQWYKGTLSSITDGVISCDKLGNVVFMNEAAQMLTGWNYLEAIGKPIWQVMDLKDFEGNYIRNPVYDLIENKIVLNAFDKVLTNKNNGSIVFIQDSASLIKNSKGEILGAVISFKNVSERKKYELELAKAKEEAERAHKATLNILEDLMSSKNKIERYSQELEKALKVKSDFISMVSHELRTPLTSVKEGISIVLDRTAGEINNTQEEFLSIAKRNIDRLHRLIDDILDFSKLESGKIKLNLKENDITKTIKEVISTFVNLASSKGIVLKYEIKNDIPLFMYDEDRIIQVLNNLISNALKFTDEGEIIVTVEYLPDTEEVKVRVSDTGRGIKTEDIPLLFQKFSQIGALKNRTIGGTGLGLAISKEIISLHNGKIFVESTSLGKGSVFTFVIPAIKSGVQK